MNGEASEDRAEASSADLVAGRSLARRCAQAMLFGAGLVTFVNSQFSHLHDVNVPALRLTGSLTMLAAIVVAALPWNRHPRASSFVVLVAAIAALVGTDPWHRYSHNDAALAVYPIFFVLIIAFAGLTQPRGTAAAVAVPCAAALAWLLHTGGHGAAAWQCLVVTIPAAAILGEVISWAHGTAITFGALDARRRDALEVLVQGASRLQHALTDPEIDATVVNTANGVFFGEDARLTRNDETVDAGPSDDVTYDSDRRVLTIRLRGQVGVLATLTTRVDEPDRFTVETARLFAQHIGGRLEQLRLIRALTDEATHDSLTGVGNRRDAETQLASLQPGDCVFILDLDHFKHINDSLGHQAGDDLLAGFGDYLRSATRPGDTVARYGGEEFVLVCRSIAPVIAGRIADRLLDGWRARRPLVTFSAGYAMHENGAVSSVTLEHADMALYEAKRSGRDQARGYAPLGSSVP